MIERYPGYDVLRKRNSLSWNDQTRDVIDARLAVDPDQHRFFDETEWPTVKALCNRILPQPANRQQPVPLAAMLDMKLHEDKRDGFRDARLPTMQTAWRIGLRAIDAESVTRWGKRFHEIESREQDLLLTSVQQGAVDAADWKGMPAALFFGARILHDLTSLYYAHPTAWSEIGFGGPASPRGYVRMNYDRRDPWEAAEAKPGEEEKARRENAHVG
jgi:hypothetical protein